MDGTFVLLLILGFVLVLGSLVALTTVGKQRPTAVLIGMFTAFTIYLVMILMRIGVIDLFGMVSRPI